VEPHEVGPQRGVVTGVTEDDGQRAAAAVHPQHGDAMIDRAPRRELDPAVGGEGGAPLGLPELDRLSGLQDRPDQAHDLVFQLARVRAYVAPLRFRHVVGHGQHLVDDRPAVRVARIQEELRTGQAVATSGLFGNRGRRPRW
jgi:hypothetical protein